MRCGTGATSASTTSSFGSGAGGRNGSGIRCAGMIVEFSRLRGKGDDGNWMRNTGGAGSSSSSSSSDRLFSILLAARSTIEASYSLALPASRLVAPLLRRSLNVWMFVPPPVWNALPLFVVTNSSLASGAKTSSFWSREARRLGISASALVPTRGPPGLVSAAAMLCRVILMGAFAPNSIPLRLITSNARVASSLCVSVPWNATCVSVAMLPLLLL